MSVGEEAPPQDEADAGVSESNVTSNAPRQAYPNSIDDMRARFEAAPLNAAAAKALLASWGLEAPDVWTSHGGVSAKVTFHDGEIFVSGTGPDGQPYRVPVFDEKSLLDVMQYSGNALDFAQLVRQLWLFRALRSYNAEAQLAVAA